MNVLAEVIGCILIVVVIYWAICLFWMPWNVNRIRHLLEKILQNQEKMTDKS